MPLPPAYCYPRQGWEAGAGWPSEANWSQIKGYQREKGTPKCPASQLLSKPLDLPRLTLVSGLHSLPPSGIQMNAEESEPGLSCTVKPPQVRDRVPTGCGVAENKGVPAPTAIWRSQGASPKRNSLLLPTLLRNWFQHPGGCISLIRRHSTTAHESGEVSPTE